MIRVRSAVDEKLKKIKGTKKERRRRRRKRRRNQWIPHYSLALLFKECVPYNTVCVYCFTLSFFLRSHYYLLFTPSLVCYDKREIIPFSNVLLTTFTFTGVQLRFKCPINCLKTCIFFIHSKKKGVATTVFLTKISVCLILLLINLSSKKLSKNTTFFFFCVCSSSSRSPTLSI